jgi:CxxC motif-containing protein
VAESEIICIGCPLGCRIKYTVNDKGEITDIADYHCKTGQRCAQEEIKAPVRTLTATVVIEEGSKRVLVPVRSNRPIHKKKMRECMYLLSRIRVKPPIKMGQVIIQNILDTGADLVSSDELLR